jgi:rRNA maturation RNase YbeY
MKIDLEINNTTQSPVEDAFFAQVAEKTLAEMDWDFLQEKELNISVALVAPAEIQELNKQHRQYDSVTDILSFAEYANIEEMKATALKNPGEVLFLGELVLCYDDIKGYAEKEGLGLEKELAKVFAHGILHLLGFSHGEEMFALQDAAAGNI